MVATQPRNRIAAHFETPEPELPKSPRERAKLWSDTVFQAVLTLKKQLRSADAKAAVAAATAILELERARMRHAKDLAGSEEVSEAQEDYEEEHREADADLRASRATKAANPAATKPGAAKPTDAEALANHARTARTAFGTGEHEMTEQESVQFVTLFFKRLGRKPSEVPAEEFAEILRDVHESAK